MIEGFLLIDKPEGRTSFSLVAEVRRLSGQKKVGHAGTLDPFATGLLILLLGTPWTRKASSFMGQEKEYTTLIRLGIATDTFDRDGTVISTSDREPSRDEVEKVLAHFQGIIAQVPPMFSAKKIAGKRLYEHARMGVEVERKPCSVEVHTTLLEYSYPYLRVSIRCSKGTYIRSIGHEIGLMLGSYGHLVELRRTKSGIYGVNEALDGSLLTYENIKQSVRQ